MKLISNICISLVVLLLASPFVSQKPTDMGTLSGRVKNLRGDALAGASVKVFKYRIFSPRLRLKDDLKVSPEVTPAQSAVTDAQGGFSFRLPFGTYVALVEDEGSVDTVTAPFKVFVDPEMQVLEIGVANASWANRNSGSVDGIVRQADKTPLADATVTLMSPYNHQVLVRARTDNQGRFEIVIPLVGRDFQYIIYAAKPGFAVSATALPKSGPVDFVLAPLPQY